MITELSLKPDLAETMARFDRWWKGEPTDRPICMLGVPPRHQPELPEPTHATLRDRWLDVEFAVRTRIARVTAQNFVGDRLPVIYPNVGPELTGTIFGCQLEFSETTSWAIPTIHELNDWHAFLEKPFDFDNVYWKTIDRATDLLIERNEGRYVPGIADLHGNMDILASLREPENLCLDCVDDPELIGRVALRAAAGYVECFSRLYDKVAAAGFGSSTWTPIYHPGPAYVPSCDFWCMLSDDMGRSIVLPAIQREMAPLERSIFHLDGPQALQHLDTLLEMDDLDAVQWVYGAGNGPAMKWLDVYKRCRAAGKSIQVIGATPDEAVEFVKALGAEGLWLDVHHGFGSIAEADDFLAKLASLS